VILSDKQLADVTQTIMDHHLAFLVRIIGLDFLPPQDVARLRRKGLIPKNPQNLPEQAFVFGVLAQGLEDSTVKGMSYGEFIEHIKVKPIPLTFEEKQAVKAVRRSIANRVKGLGNLLDQKTQQVMIEADHGQRRRLETRIRSTLVQGIEKRKSVAQVAGALARLTKDMQRDWHRVAATEMHNAFIEGRVASIQKRNSGVDPLVFKRCRSDACDHCKDHYLEKDGMTPKVFKLSELVANGTTNEGRTLGNWKSTLGCLHPWCQCTLHELPPGFAFDHKGNLQYAGVRTGS
jgi:hypothetical protein